MSVADAPGMRVDEAMGLEVTITPDTPKRLHRCYIAAVTHGVALIDEPSDDAARGAASGAGFDKLGLPIDLAGKRERLWVVVEGYGRAILQDVIDRA